MRTASPAAIAEGGTEGQDEEQERQGQSQGLAVRYRYRVHTLATMEQAADIIALTGNGWIAAELVEEPERWTNPDKPKRTNEPS